MFAYFLAKGHDLHKLLSLTLIEKVFYQQAMIHAKTEEVAMHNAMWGGGKK